LSERQFGAVLLTAQHGAVGGFKPERYHIQISFSGGSSSFSSGFQPVLFLFGGASFSSMRI
jgi:hypothetical protein